MTIRVKLRRLGLGASLAAVLALLSARSARPQTESGRSPLRITTRIVNLNVVVTDNQGHPVKDLPRDDFIILDDGHPQPIAFFSTVDDQQPPSAVPTPGPDTYTNNPAAHSVASSVAILLFDTVHTRWVSQGYALHRVRKFLRQIQPQDHIGIYVLSGDLKVVHDFARDASDLVVAIRRYDEQHAHGAGKQAAEGEESTGNQALDRFLSGKEMKYHSQAERPGGPGGFARARFEWARQITAESMAAIARQLSTVPGRKTLIWVTDYLGEMGFFLNDDLSEDVEAWRGRSSIKASTGLAWENGANVERMIRLMNDAGVTVYPVNAEGLVTGVWRSVTWAQPAMDELAKRTGGRAFYNRNDLETGIRQALDDARFTYSLAYYPDHDKWKGEWRKIQVKVNRPGLKVLTRGGYFALPDSVPVPQRNRAEFLSEVALSPVESTQLPLSVRMTKSSSPEGPKIYATVHFDLQALLTSQEDGHWKGNFEVLLMQLDGKNNLLDASTKGVDSDLKPEKYATVSQKGWDLPIRLKWMPGATLLYVVLHDTHSSRVGSVRIPLARYSAR